MDSRTLAAVCSKIYLRFPGLKGIAPKVQPYPGDKSLLVFKGSGQAPDGRTIPLTVRVVVGADGKIGKITTSR